MHERVRRGGYVISVHEWIYITCAYNMLVLFTNMYMYYCLWILAVSASLQPLYVPHRTYGERDYIVGYIFFGVFVVVLEPRQI